MNPERPETPREEIEVRVTALLMGELPPEEAAALSAQIARDPQLTALHAQLKQAIELLREATAIPEPSTLPSPAKLSTDRREQLLAHFKGIVTMPVAPQPRRDWKWIMPLGLAASLIALIGGAVLLDSISRRKLRSLIAN
jgi:anti-sigma factor RsiW